MTINVVVSDLYLDFTYSSEVSIERRFFVEFETNEKTQEVLVFMSEMNSTFEKYNTLKNIVLLNNKDLIEDFKEKQKEKDNCQYNKELLILEEIAVYKSLKDVIVSKLESLEDNHWLNYCAKRYAIHNIAFTEQLKEKELNKFHKSNEVMKQLWSQFPESFVQFKLSGDMDKSQTIPYKFEQFWKGLHYLYLEKRLPQQGMSGKKSKI